MGAAGAPAPPHELHSDSWHRVLRDVRGGQSAIPPSRLRLAFITLRRNQ